MGRPPRIRVSRTTFAEAIDATAEQRRHLLLGNGFSIAAHPQFEYGSLLDAAGQLTPRLSGVFRELGTTDFEITLNFLNQAEAVLGLYDAPVATRRRFERDAAALKAHLVNAITAVHPLTSAAMNDAEYEACRDFLALFTAPERQLRGRIFTTNYDLLLYWVMVRHAQELRCDDGFRGPAPLRWNPALLAGQSLFFLHGGLHLYESDDRVHKLNFRPDASLLDQIRVRLDADEQPLFVSEGSSEQKLLRIAESEYLRTAHKAFGTATRNRQCALFTVGHALGDQDRHITDAIGRGRVPTIYIGAHGGLHSNDGIRARTLAQRWEGLRTEREEYFPIEVFVFDTNGCEIWAPL
jgi:hypothetical protein